MCIYAIDHECPKTYSRVLDTGEFVRYLRICSDEKYYIICSNRLADALVWLQYPQRVMKDKLIPWSERHMFLGVEARKS